MRVATAGLLLVSSIMAAQAPGEHGPVATTQPAVRTQTNVVLVPALVRNARGELVFSLKAGDFKVTDDGVEQKLTLDQDTGSEPLALVVAVQTGGAGRSQLAAYQHLGAVIDAVVGGVPHRVAVVSFDSAPQLEQDFDADAMAAGETLDNLDPGDKGAAILDALKFSVDQLRTQPAGYRRAILLISETLDSGSQVRMNEALRAISDTNTAIYSLGFSSGQAAAEHYAYKNLPTQPNGLGLSNPNPNPPHGCMGKDPDPDATTNKAVQAFDCLTQLFPPLGLAKMAAIRVSDGLERNVPETVARLTGGEYYKFENNRALVNDLLAISNHVPNRYILSFQPQSPHPGYHAVELKLKHRSGLRVQARSGYWADANGPDALLP